MAVTNEVKSRLAATLKEIVTGIDPVRQTEPSGTSLSRITTHGALQALAEPDSAVPQIQRFLSGGASSRSALDFTITLSSLVQDFFYKIEDTLLYDIPSSLISHLTFPHEGRTWTYNDHDNASNISVVVTFMGQFIDHDLTKNIIDLVLDQTAELQDFATPMIDLDSVYGPRFDPNALGAPMEADGRFQLTQLGTKAYDVKRDAQGGALIPDTRNDENQLILQIHILLMRLHNTFVASGMDFDSAKRETIFNWQSVVINDYLPKVVDENTLTYVLGEIVKPDYGNLIHKPDPNPPPGHHRLRMPHEFGIGFRFGHSQLRSHYHLNPNYLFPLFDNRSNGPDFPDLRGNRPLQIERIIDWPFFLNFAHHSHRRSNRIDTKVTQKVFDLPESTIPDNIKKFGNLPQRNLVRSAKLKLTSGERLAAKYGIQALSPAQVEPDGGKHHLFIIENNEFATPLWFYLLKEAEIRHGGLKLGPLGGRLVAEVVGGGVYYDTEAYIHDAGWTSAITGSRVVTFLEIVQFVQQGPN